MTVKQTSPATNPPTVEEIGQQIQDLSKQVSALLKQNGEPEPSFAVDGPSTFPATNEELSAVRAKLLDQTKLLYDLVRGPDDHMRDLSTHGVETVVLHWLTHFNIAKHVPLDKAISYPDLAVAAKVPERLLRQIVRFATTVHVFLESEPGKVSHTAASRLLIDDPKVVPCVDYGSDVIMSILQKMVPATEIYKGSEEPNETAFNLAFDTRLSMYAWFEETPRYAERFKRLMAGMNDSERFHPRHIVASYDWRALGAGTVVDVGGSTGHCCIEVAKVAPDIKFIIQDLPEVVKDCQGEIPKELSERFSFQAYDFFEPQPVKDADIYLFSQIFHNWSDAYCIKILKQVVPSMKKGAKIMIRDSVVPPLGVVENFLEKEMRVLDMIMLTHFNSKEREIEDWADLCARADPRLRIVRDVTPPTSVHTIIEVELSGEAAPKQNGS